MARPKLIDVKTITYTDEGDSVEEEFSDLIKPFIRELKKASYNHPEVFTLLFDTLYRNILEVYNGE